jgi:MoaA/NifB/PqqE/SkfB family radical SAM enzyme
MSDSERSLDQAKAAAVSSWFRGEPLAPYSMEISPTMACNVNCLFCRKKDELADYYARTKDLPDDRWFEILSQAIEQGTRRLFFRGGGDPLLKRALLTRLFPLIQKHGVTGVILTNGTLIDERLAEGFVRSGWSQIIVSLHGGDAASHDQIVDTPGSFARVERSLNLVNEFKRRLGGDRPVLSFHVVLTRRIYREIDKIIDVAARHQVNDVGVFPMHNAPYPHHVVGLDMRPEDLREYALLVPGYKAALEGLGIGHDFQLAYQAETPREAAAPAPTPAETAASLAAGTGPLIGRLPCYFPWHHAAITPNGFVAPCCYGEGGQTKGDLHRDDFTKVWRERDMGEVRETMMRGELMPYCAKCPNWYQDDNRRIRALLSSPAAETTDAHEARRGS